MAVTRVGSSTTVSGSGVTSLSVSRNVSTGNLLTTQTAYYNGSGTVTISSVVFNTSENFTSVITSANSLFGGSDKRSAIHRLASPTATTANVVITFSGSAYPMMTVEEWSSVDTASPTHDATANNSEGTTPTVNVANVVSGEVTIDAMCGGSTPSVGAGQTQSQNVNLVGSNYGATSYDTTTTGTNTMSWTTGDTSWCTCAVALKEGGAAAASLLVPRHPMAHLLVR